MADWPLTLPTFAEASGWGETPRKGHISTPVEQGPPITFRDPSGEPTTLQFQQLLSREQTVLLDTFYVTTLKDGTLSFDEQHPRTLTTESFKFKSRPTYSHIGGNYFVSQMEVIVLP